MSNFVLRIAAVLLLVLTGAVAPAADKEHHFKALGEGDIGYSGYLEGMGKARHLGSSALLVFLDSDYFGEGGLFIPSSFGQLTAANNDFLLFSFGPDVYLIDPVGIVSVPLTFAGGTGRFVDATGSADALFMFDWDTGRFAYLIDGSIDY